MWSGRSTGSKEDPRPRGRRKEWAPEEVQPTEDTASGMRVKEVGASTGRSLIWQCAACKHRQKSPLHDHTLSEAGVQWCKWDASGTSTTCRPPSVLWEHRTTTSVRAAISTCNVPERRQADTPRWQLFLVHRHHRTMIKGIMQGIFCLSFAKYYAVNSTILILIFIKNVKYFYIFVFGICLEKDFHGLTECCCLSVSKKRETREAARQPYQKHLTHSVCIFTLSENWYQHSRWHNIGSVSHWLY